MKSPNLLILLLIPILLEATGIRGFLISIPGSPLSLGGLGLTAFGISSMVTNTKEYSYFFTAFLLIFLGTIGGSFFSSDFISNLSASVAQLLFVFSAYGVALELCKHNRLLFLLIDICMVSTFIYWTYYIFDKTLLSNNFISYTKLTFTKGPNQAINHHVPGFHISIASTYISARLAMYHRSISYAVMGSSIVCCLLIESRSNIIFCIIGLIWLIAQQQRINVWHLFLSIFSLYVIFNFAYSILNQYDFISQRFNSSDEEYQSATTMSRVYLYQNFLPTFFQKPLGMGLRNPRILYEYTYLNPHNQYLTYILAGGVISMAGVIIFFKTFYKVFFKNQYRLGNSISAQYIIPFKGSMLVLFGTLLTIELGAAMFILGMALLMFLELQYTIQIKVERKMRIVKLIEGRIAHK
jgi:hypothetical protein